MVLPVLYGAVRTGIQSADPQLLEMTKVFRLPLGRRLRAGVAACGAAGLPAGMQRGPWHLLEERCCR